MKVYYLVHSEMLTSVIPSQVIAPARFYAEATPGLDAHIIFLEAGSQVLRRATRQHLRFLQSLWPAGRMTLLPYVNRLGPDAPARSLAWYLRRQRATPFVLHCRGPHITLQAAQLKARYPAIRIVFDVRGAQDYETELRMTRLGKADAGQIARAVALNRTLDGEAARRADALITVSSPLLERMRGLADLTTKPSAVVPCCVPAPFVADVAARADYRQRLGLVPDNLLFVHISTVDYWEDFPLPLAFFRLVRERQPLARLLFLTTLSPALITASLAADDDLRQSLLFRQAAPNEVPHYLKAAEVGLLLRQPHPTHHYASPIKFVEYLAAGLGVVVSEGIGGLGALAKQHKVGLALPDNPSPATLQDLACLAADWHTTAPQLRQRALSLCHSHFTWAGYLATMQQLYGLTNQPPASH